MITRKIIEELPKTDLHVHLDGSVRLETLIELAREYRVELPSYTTGGLQETVFKEHYQNLVEYLRGFRYTVSVMQHEPALERVAYELGIDNQEEGVRYVEVRFAPQLHVHSHLSIENVLRAVARGLDKAKQEFNAREAVKNGSEPGFEYSIIVCALRYFGRGSSEYFDDLLGAHRYSTPKKVFSLASLELAQAAVHIAHNQRLPITGFDLAGAEAGYPASDHAEAYDYAHRHFLKKTVHAGEAYGPESIFQAITNLHADRIGHGTFLMDTLMIADETIEDREEYVSDLAQYIADRRVTLEICLTSNMQTNPKLRDLANHPLRKFKEARLSTTFCTDNRTVSNTSVSLEIERAIKHLGVGAEDLKHSIIYGFKRSFFPGSYLEKRRYVRGIIDYYESIESKHQSLRSSKVTRDVKLLSSGDEGED